MATLRSKSQKYPPRHRAGIEHQHVTRRQRRLSSAGEITSQYPSGPAPAGKVRYPLRAPSSSKQPLEFPEHTRQRHALPRDLVHPRKGPPGHGTTFGGSGRSRPPISPPAMRPPRSRRSPRKVAARCRCFSRVEIVKRHAQHASLAPRAPPPVRRPRAAPSDSRLIPSSSGSRRVPCADVVASMSGAISAAPIDGITATGVARCRHHQEPRPARAIPRTGSGNR